MHVQYVRVHVYWYSRYIENVSLEIGMHASILDCPHQPSEMLTSFYHYIFSMHRSVRYILLRKVDEQERNGDYPIVQSMGWKSKKW